MKAFVSKRSQRGIVLMEALVASLLFVVGVLALVSVAGRSAANQSDIQLRTQASKLTSEIMDTIWVTADRTSPANLLVSLAQFQHQATTNAYCSFTGTAATNGLVGAWVNKAVNGAVNPSSNSADPMTRMPGSTAAMQQIVVNAANNNEVTVRLCWQSSNDAAPRQHMLRAYIH